MVVHQGGKDCVVRGLHAAGEAVSNCHGANRLGANSILDVVVFGKAIADNIGRISKPGDVQPDLNDVRCDTFLSLSAGCVSSEVRLAF